MPSREVSLIPVRYVPRRLCVADRKLKSNY